MDRETRSLVWVRSARKDLKGFPEKVRRKFGFALWQAQQDEMPIEAKVLKGFQGAGVIEIRADLEGSTFRLVYTVRFPKLLYILHAFQKKSTKGIKTPPTAIDLVKKRLKFAEEHY